MKSGQWAGRASYAGSPQFQLEHQKHKRQKGDWKNAIENLCACVSVHTHMYIPMSESASLFMQTMAHRWRAESNLRRQPSSSTLLEVGGVSLLCALRITGWWASRDGLSSATHLWRSTRTTDVCWSAQLCGRLELRSQCVHASTLPTRQLPQCPTITFQEKAGSSWSVSWVCAARVNRRERRGTQPPATATTLGQWHQFRFPKH